MEALVEVPVEDLLVPVVLLIPEEKHQLLEVILLLIHLLNLVLLAQQLHLVLEAHPLLQS